MAAWQKADRAIIEAKDDVGQITFLRRFAGLADLRERLTHLEQEADGLWDAADSERRLYSQAENRLENARSRLRDYSLSAKDWQAARTAVSNAESSHEQRRAAVRGNFC